MADFINTCTPFFLFFVLIEHMAPITMLIVTALQLRKRKWGFSIFGCLPLMTSLNTIMRPVDDFNCKDEIPYSYSWWGVVLILVSRLKLLDDSSCASNTSKARKTTAETPLPPQLSTLWKKWKWSPGADQYHLVKHECIKCLRCFARSEIFPTHEFLVETF